MRRTFARYAKKMPRAKNTPMRTVNLRCSVRMNAAKADAKIEKLYTPEHAVVMITLTGWPEAVMKARIGAPSGPGVTTFGTPRTPRMAPVSGARATAEYAFTLVSA